MKEGKNKRLVPVETFFVMHLLTFGVILLLPNDTFSSNVYSTMKIISSETIWGIVCIFVSVFHFLSMIYKSKKGQVFGLSLITFFYSFLGTMFLISSINDGIYNTGITYFVVSGLALWLSYTIGGQNE